jgi:hypothetical protein
MIPRVNSTCLHVGARMLVIAIVLLLVLFTCGCSQIDPEELGPEELSPTPTPIITSLQSPTLVPAETSAPAPILISHAVINLSRPKDPVLFTKAGFPPAIHQAVWDFTDGKTSETINGFLRWESVRAKANRSETAAIRSRIGDIDYAISNSSAGENLILYTGISGELAKRIRNDSAYEERGYIVASYDPSVVYHQLAQGGRDKDGFITMVVTESRRGEHLLFINDTEHSVLLPHGSVWDLAWEEQQDVMDFSVTSFPRYQDEVLTKVRLMYMKEHP